MSNPLGNISSEDLVIFVGHSEDAKAEAQVILGLEKQLTSRFLSLRGNGCRFKALRMWQWEEDAIPLIGGQRNVIDPVLSRSDIAVFVFRACIGKGTDHELNLCLTQAGGKKPVVLLFPKSPPDGMHERAVSQRWDDMVSKRDGFAVEWLNPDGRSAVYGPLFVSHAELRESALQQLERAIEAVCRSAPPEPPIIEEPKASHWDAALTNVTDFDSEAVKEFRDQLRPKQKDLYPKKFYSDADFLEKVGFRKEGRLNRAGVLLFTSNPEGEVIGAEIQFVRYLGNGKGKAADVRDRRSFTGPLFRQIKEAQDAIAAAIEKVEVPTAHSPKPEILYRFPMKCVDEVLANAVCHRQYGGKCGHERHVHIEVFQDRIKVISPGAWSGEISLLGSQQTPLGQMSGNNVSTNPLIARGIGMIGLVEQAGEGIPTAVTECREVGCPEPEARYSKDGYVEVTIFPRKEWPPLPQKTLTAAEIENTGLLDNLAALGTGGEADAVLSAVEFPSSWLPSQKTDARAFWHQISERIENGAIEGDQRLERLLAAAADRVPGNEALHHYKKHAFWENAASQSNRLSAQGSMLKAPSKDVELTLRELAINGFLDELAQGLGLGGGADVVLVDIGFPHEQVPAGQNDPLAFWHQICRRIEAGAIPGNRRFERLLGCAAIRLPGNKRLAPFRQYASSNSGPAPEGVPTAGIATAGQPSPLNSGVTLTLGGIRNRQSCLDTVRRFAAAQSPQVQVHLHHAGRSALVFHLPQSTTEQALQLAESIGDALLNDEPDLHTNVSTSSTRDYLLRTVYAEGPEQSRFAMNNVPGSSTVAELATAIMNQYDPKVWGEEKGKRRPAVVDHMKQDGSTERLKPEKTLAESGIQQGDTVHVAPESRAGASGDSNAGERLSPEQVGAQDIIQDGETIHISQEIRTEGSGDSRPSHVLDLAIAMRVRRSSFLVKSLKPEPFPRDIQYPISRKTDQTRTDPSSTLDEAERYRRHDSIAGWNQSALGHATVVIAGMGALGNEVARILASSGVGKLIICDPDVVAVSNLSRTPLFRATDVGRLKVEAAGRELRALNPAIEIDARAQVLANGVGLAELRDAKLVLGCLDSRVARLQLASRCNLVGAPNIDGGTNPWGGEVRMHLSPDGPCYSCGLSTQDRGTADVPWSCTDVATTTKHEGAAAPSAALVGSWMACMAIRFLMGLPCPQGLLAIDLARGTTRNVPTERSPDCPLHEPIGKDLTVSSKSIATVGELREELAEGESVVLWEPVMYRVECPKCGYQQAKWGVPQKLDCPTCGNNLRARTKLDLEGAPEDISLASLGVPPREILSIKTKDQYRWLELK